jgi:hypothetical protein
MKTEGGLICLLELLIYPALLSDQSQDWKSALWLESHFLVRLTTRDNCGELPYHHSLVPLGRRIHSTTESIEDYICGFQNLEIRWITTHWNCS